jgi:hypothetical protein
MRTFGIFLFVMVAMMASFWLVSLGTSFGYDKAKREAVQAGAAHYVTDSDTGNPKFVWGKAP